MAKINRKKNRRNRVINDLISTQSVETSFKTECFIFLQKGLWPIKGVHKGKKLSDLDTSYLEYITKTFDNKSQASSIAQTELSHRQIILSQKIKSLRQATKI